MTDNTGVLYLALDACDPATMLRLVADGRCPNLAGLLSEAATVETVAPYGTFVGSTWMTVATGLRVCHHQYFNRLVLDTDTYELRHRSPREALGTPFWLRLSEQGRRVAVFDVPDADLPDELDGVLVREWGCHNRHCGTGSYPVEIIEELDDIVGGHPYGSRPTPGAEPPFAPCDYLNRAGVERTLDEERQVLDAILSGVEAKRQAAQALLARGGWDAFVSVVGESHCVGHQLWHVHDESHSRHDRVALAALGDPVEQVYERLDALIGEQLHIAGRGATSFIHLSHGMQAHHDGNHLLDEVLRRIELFHDNGQLSGWRTKAAGQVIARSGDANRRRLQHVAATFARRRIRVAPPPLSKPPGPSAERRWYQVPNGSAFGAIQFNVRGRDPHGWVGPDEVDELSGEVASGLLELVNVDTGRPAVRRVVRTEDVLDRSEGDPFPDLFVEWDRSSAIERVWSPRVGTVVTASELWRTGGDTDRGLLIVRGPGITPGRRAFAMALEDIAPTVCSVVGVELEGVDGKTRHDVLGTPAAGNGSPAGMSLASPPRARALSRPRRALGHELAEAALELAHAAAKRSDVAIARVDELAAELVDLRARSDFLERANLVWTTMRWLDDIGVAPDHLVSVITPTHERPEKLAVAIQSVLAQTYPNWELVVVDDGSDTAKSVVAQIGDERVHAYAVSHRGPSAARNVALDLARGDIIAYLDDDNTLDSGWLKAVVWAFEAQPEVDVLYGARLIDDETRLHGDGSGGMPWVHFKPFDRDTLRHVNMVDMGTIAHRAGAPGARFDEDLWACEDWDFFLAITEHRPPLELPALALRYHTEGADHLSLQYPESVEVVRNKWRAPAP